MKASAKVITAAIALFLLIVPNVADWSPTHIYHEAWTGHARLHTVWQLVMQSVLAVTAILLVWEGKVRAACFMNLVILGSFFIAFALMHLGVFEATLSDMPDGQGRVAGIDGNLLAFSILATLQLFARLFLMRGEKL